MKFFFFLLSRGLHFLFGVNDCCRFTPTCSQYSTEAINKFGWIKGGRLAVGRLFRCHPFHSRWGHDPVPLK